MVVHKKIRLLVSHRIFQDGTCRYKLKMSEYRGEQAEMNIQRLNVRIDQVRMVVTVMLGDLNDGHTVFKRESE